MNDRFIYDRIQRGDRYSLDETRKNFSTFLEISPDENVNESGDVCTGNHCYSVPLRSFRLGCTGWTLPEKNAR